MASRDTRWQGADGRPRSLDLSIKKSLGYQMPPGAGSLVFPKRAVRREPLSAGLELRTSGARRDASQGV